MVNSCLLEFHLELKTMTGHMQRLMERLLGPLASKPFQDDVAIASRSEEEHVKDVQEVLELLTYKAGLRLKIEEMPIFPQAS